MMIKFVQLLRRGTGIQLMNVEGGESNSTTTGGGTRLALLLAPVMPLIRWWWGEVGAMLPLAVRRLLSADRLQARLSHDQLCFIAPDNVAGEISCYPMDGRLEKNNPPSVIASRQRCNLLLEDSLVLMRELELPLEAERSLRRVLSFSMDRYTPFTDSDVVFDYKVIQRDTANKKILLRLYVARRDGVEPAIGALASMGIEVASVDIVSDVPSGREGVDLCPPEWRSGTAGIARLDRLLGVSALLLLFAVVALPLWQRHQLTAHLETEFAGMRGQLVQAEKDHQNLLERKERMSLIQQQTSEMPAVLDVLLELTRLMPDESWAGQVSMSAGRVRLSGEARAASELLAQLSQSSIFSDPRFEAPLTQNPKTEHERFVISLAVGNNNAP